MRAFLSSSLPATATSIATKVYLIELRGLTFIFSAEVCVDQSVHLLAEACVECLIVHHFFFLKQSFNVGRRNFLCNEIHAVQLLNEGTFDFVSSC
jgi:hypothetical protein